MISPSAHTHAHLNDIRSASVWVGYFIFLPQLLISPLPLWRQPLQWVDVCFFGVLLDWFLCFISLSVFFISPIVHAQIPAILLPLNVVVLEILYTHMSGPICRPALTPLAVPLWMSVCSSLFLLPFVCLFSLAPPFVKSAFACNVFDVRVWHPFFFFIPTHHYNPSLLSPSFFDSKIPIVFLDSENISYFSGKT